MRLSISVTMIDMVKHALRIDNWNHLQGHHRHTSFVDFRCACRLREAAFNEFHIDFNCNFSNENRNRITRPYTQINVHAVKPTSSYLLNLCS